MQCDMLKSTLTTVRREVKELSQDKKLLDCTLQIYKVGKIKADKLQHEVNILNVEKSAIEKELLFHHNERRRVEAAHKNAVSHVIEGRKLKLETQQLTVKRLLHKEKLKMKEQELQITAFKEKTVCLEKELSEKERKAVAYKDLTG